MLEEFLQEKYVERYEDFEENNNRIVNFVDAYPQYFYIPRDKGFGTLDYIEYNGKALYLIEKKSLPEEIRESLVGGDAGKGEYTDYVGLNDVYGVNSKLKVYYCSNGMDSITNLGKDDIDEAIERDVFSNLEEEGGLGELLQKYDANKDGKIQSSEISSITELEITEPVDLKDIYNLYSLKKLIIKEVSNVDLTGIENCAKLNYIWFYKGSAKSYEPIGKLGSKLNQLYFSHITDDYLTSLCEDLRSYDLSGLTHLGFFGSTGNMHTYNYGPEKNLTVTYRDDMYPRTDKLTSMSSLDKLKNKTSLKYLWIYGCQITDLSGIQSFHNLYYLNVYGNNISNINGIEKLTNVEYLRLTDNKFNDSDEKQNNENDALYNIQNLKNLYWLDLSINSGIKYISYLSSLSSLKYLFMDGCSNLSSDDVVDMKSFINGMNDKSYDSKYEKKLIEPSKQTSLSYYGETIDFTDFKIIAQCTKLTQLNLRKTKVVKSSTDNIEADEDTVEGLMNKVFKNLEGLLYLSLDGLTIQYDGSAEKIKDLSFLPSTLKYLDIQNTDVVAKGDTTNKSVKLDSELNNLSITNTKKLNSLSNLISIAVNTDKFDFSELQTMLNRFSSSETFVSSDLTFSGIYTGERAGLQCSNWTSFRTLENCDNITKLISFSRLGTLVGTTNSLDLSNCNQLKEVFYFNWGQMSVKFPNTIKKIAGAYTLISFDFESKSDGSPVHIDEIKLDEMTGAKLYDTVIQLASKNITLNKLNMTAIFSDYALGDALLRNGVCNWVEYIYYKGATWSGDIWDRDELLTSLDNLVNTETKKQSCSIRNFEYDCFPNSNLDCLKNFTMLTNLILRNSKLVDLGCVEPTYDSGKCVSGFPNLEQLTIQNSLTDITPVGTLTNLKKLNVSGNKINKGIEALGSLTKLEYINLSNCSSLSQNQTYVDLATGNGTDTFVDIFKNLHQSGHLTELYLTGTGIKNIRQRLESGGSWGLLSDNKTQKLQCDS